MSKIRKGKGRGSRKARKPRQRSPASSPQSAHQRDDPGPGTSPLSAPDAPEASTAPAQALGASGTDTDPDTDTGGDVSAPRAPRPSMPTTPSLQVTEPDETGRWPSLTARQELAVFLHAAGLSYAEVGRRLGVRRQTVSGWFADDAVQDALQTLQAETRAQVQAIFVEAGAQALHASLLAIQTAAADLGHSSYKARHSAGRLINQLARTVLGHGEHPAKLDLSGSLEGTAGVKDALDDALGRLAAALPSADALDDGQV